MKLVSSWIKELLGRTMLSDQDLSHALEQAGMEVEQISSSKQIDDKVIVAEVKKVVQHPGADRLRLATVETGNGEVAIVCGAPNLKPGMKAALAQIGSVLPGGEKIQKAKLRGELSEGMLCSELELGLGKDHNGIIELSSDLEVGTPLCDVFPTDGVIDIKTPANRFDVQSVQGLAREVAAMINVQLTLPSLSENHASSAGPEVNKDSDASRYMLALVKIAELAPSPNQVKSRLRLSGMRPISPIVDVTNYVMLETGQPLHAFDAAKVKLPISARRARSGEMLKTLDGVDRKLTTDDLVIADQSGPIALAGLMGGSSSEVGTGTTEILLEAAVFDPVVVRKMAKRHGLRTEASARFERGLPVELPPLGLDTAIQMLESAGGKFVTLTDQINSKPEHYELEFATPWLSRLLGIPLLGNEAVAALLRLQIPAEVVKQHKTAGNNSNDEIVIVREVPWWRPDLRLPEDLAEEIVRVIGYDRIPATLPSWRPSRLAFDRERSKVRQVRDVMYGSGLFEVMTYSFISEAQLEQLGLDAKQHLKLRNPLSLEQAFLRSTMLASHLAVLSRNRGYSKIVGMYEISKVFVKRNPGDQPDEPQRLSITLQRPESSLQDLKGLLDSLAWELNLTLEVSPAQDTVFVDGQSGDIRLALGKSRLTVGRIGRVKSRATRQAKLEGEVAFLEVDLAPLLKAAGPRQFAGLDRYPTISRDVSVLIGAEKTWQEVAEVLAGQRVEYVGEYYDETLPNGLKSLTFRFTLANTDRTPNEAEAADLESTLLSRLEHKMGARPRD